MHLFFSKRQQIPCDKEEAIPRSLSPLDQGYCCQPSEPGASQTTARQLSANPSPKPWRCTGDKSSGKRGQCSQVMGLKQQGTGQDPGTSDAQCPNLPYASSPSRATANVTGNSSEKHRKGKRKVLCTQSSKSPLTHHSQDFNASPRKKGAKKEHQASLPARHLLQQYFWVHCVFPKSVPSQNLMILARSDLSTETHTEVGAQVFHTQLVISGAWFEVLWRGPISESAKHLPSGKEVDLQVPFTRPCVENFSWEHWLKAYCKGQVGVIKGCLSTQKLCHSIDSSKEQIKTHDRMIKSLLHKYSLRLRPYGLCLHHIQKHCSSCTKLSSISTITASSHLMWRRNLSSYEYYPGSLITRQQLKKSWYTYLLAIDIFYKHQG